MIVVDLTEAAGGHVSLKHSIKEWPLRSKTDSKENISDTIQLEVKRTRVLNHA